MHKLLGVFIFVWFSLHVNAQDSLVPAPAPAKDTVKTHSWKKAVLFSAVLPGAGQVYNHIAMPKGKKKAYWKTTPQSCQRRPAANMVKNYASTIVNHSF